LIYVFDITTPANTPESNPLRTTLKLAKGITYKVDFLFPPGPLGLLHLRVCKGLYQVWPSNPEADFSTDDETISFEDEYLIDEPPYELTAITWNEDDTYEHRVTIRIGLKPLPISVYLTEEELAQAAMG
jgi:hypothetical protein